MKRFLNMYRLGMLLCCSGVQADNTVPAQLHTQVNMAPNGVPIVNIATPNSEGISHNTYQHFNIPSQGMVLNNAHQSIQTQLAGMIAGNPNLTGPAAALIINEVTHANPSQLRGMLEVAGHATTAVIANPWGITCNGCGFINTPYAALTTGKPQFDAHGNLTSYRIEGGHITIEGRGLDAKNSDYLSIMTGALIVNAQVYANDLQVILGANQIDAHMGKIDAITRKEQLVPGYALDVAMLGGMYANKIKLIGTEKGLGVNHAGVWQAQQSIQINHSGDIMLSGSVHTAALKMMIPERLPYTIHNTGLIKVSGLLNLDAGNMSNAPGGKIDANSLLVGNNSHLTNSGYISTGSMQIGE